MVSAQTSNGASATPMRNSTLILSAARTCGMSLHQPKSIAGRIGADGSISGLPRKKASPVPNSISAMPTAMSLTRGKPQIAACSKPSSAPDMAAASTPSQGEPVR